VIAVVDASVVLKWLLADPGREADTGRAASLMRSIVAGETAVLQPPHWLIETGAVLARLSPATAVEDITLLRALDLPATDEPAVLRRACRLAIDLGQHLFDTLYHAVALETDGGVFVTADERYLRAARPVGGIVRLADWPPSADPARG
jgi:predicted nucleic acid-binding protein